MRCGKETRRVIFCVRMLAAMLAVVFLTGCSKVSSEKRDEVAQALSSLDEARAKAEETYDQLYDDALFVRLTEAGKQLDALKETELSSMTDEEVDATLLTKTAELAEAYSGMQEIMDSLLAAQEAEEREREGKKQLFFSVLNESGQALETLRFMQGDEKAPVECLSLLGPLAEGETLAGITVTVRDEAKESLWVYGGLTAPEEAQTDPAEDSDKKSDDQEDKKTGSEEETQEDEESDGDLRYLVGDTGDFSDTERYRVTLLPEGEVKVGP